MDSRNEQHLNRPLTVGDVTLPNRAILAPLAGVSDVPFRRICAEMGAGLTFVEMLAAGAVLQGNRATVRVLVQHPEEPRVGAQITGPEPDSVAEACRVLEGEGYAPIDLNMGCPVRKIVRKGWGSALLRDPGQVSRIVEACRGAVAGTLSVKIRIGYHPGAINVDDVAERIARAGADMLTIHGRTRSDHYGVPVDLEAIRRGGARARAASGRDIVIIGNGDVLRAEDAAPMMREAECDGVMISRGALGNPWIFQRLEDPAKSHPTIGQWREVLFRHLDYHEAHYGRDEHAAVLVRKHLLWYVSGFPSTRRLRERVRSLVDLDDVRREVDRYVEGLPPDLVRYTGERDGEGGARPASYDPKYDMDRRADRAAADEEEAGAAGSASGLTGRSRR